MNTSPLPSTFHPLIHAWDQFFRFCTPLISHALTAYHLTEADRDDCIQEVWKEVVVKLHDFQFDTKRARFRTWLSALARNKAVDVVRRRVRHPLVSLDGQGGTDLCDLNIDPASQFERIQTQVQVRSVLAKLSQRVSARTYQVLYLHWIEGQTMTDIAVNLNLTPEQVRFRHHRVKQQFRRLFELSGGSCPSL
jgi:RNA polymerase sigma-70 factor (ECF subfamily)